MAQDKTGVGLCGIYKQLTGHDMRQKNVVHLPEKSYIKAFHRKLPFASLVVRIENPEAAKNRYLRLLVSSHWNILVE